MAKEITKVPQDSRLTKLKQAFLYVLIGGLVISAVVSVVAILIGEFNDVVQKALLTTLTFVIHSLLILTIVAADRFNQLGKSLVPTIILVSVMANMITSTVGIWQLWADDTSWKAFLIYVLAIGAAFLISAIMKLRIAQTITRAGVYTTVALTVVLTGLLVAWIVLEPSQLSDFYYRLVGATTILLATALSVTVIVRRIATGRNHALLQTRPAKTQMSGGMLAILITTGSLVGLFWMIGLLGFIYQAAQSTFEAQPKNQKSIYKDRFDR